MSMSKNQEYECPSCGKIHEVKIYDSINVTVDPSLKKIVTFNTFNLLKCKQCNQEYPINVDFIYHDMEKQFLIYLKVNNENIPALDIGQFSSYRLRIVEDRNELIEKVLIFDDQMSDLDIELIKFVNFNLMAKFNMNEKIFYNGLRKKLLRENQYIFYQLGEEQSREHIVGMNSFPKEFISKYSNPKYAPNGEWLAINSEFVLELLEVSGAVKKLETTSVHILDLYKGYIKEKWKIDKDIDFETYKEFRDENNELYAVRFPESYKDVGYDESIESMDELFDKIFENINNAQLKIKVVSKDEWFILKNENITRT